MEVADATRSAQVLTVAVSLPTGQRWRTTHADSTVQAAVQHGRVTFTVAPDGNGNSHRAVWTT